LFSVVAVFVLFNRSDFRRRSIIKSAVWKFVNYPTLPCTVCNARGYIGERQCPNCRGFAFLTGLNEYILGWRLPLDVFSVFARKSAKRANKAINFILLLIAAAAVGEMVFGLFMGMPLSMEYWTQNKNGPLLFFWFGVFCLFIYFSRRRAARYAADPVIRLSYSEDPIKIDAPLGWEAARQIPRARFIDTARSYSASATSVMERAVALSERLSHPTVGATHLFAALLDDKEVRVIFARAGITIGGLSERAERALAEIVPEDKRSALGFSFSAQSAVLGAYVEAARWREDKVETSAILLCVAEDAVISDILTDVGVTPEILRNIVAWSRINNAMRNRIKRYRAAASLRPTGSLDRAMTAIATPILDRYSVDLTRAAQAGRLPFLVDREKEMNIIMRAIEGGRSSVALVGEPGVGKDAIIYGIAERMVEEDVPPQLRDKRLVSLSVSELIAGASEGEAADRLLRALDEVARSKNIVLSIENIDALAGVSSGGMELSDVFAAELSRGYFRCFATSYPSRYKNLEGHPLGSALERVDIREPEGDEAIRILMSIVGRIEGEARVFFTYQAIERAVVLSSRYLHDRYLPEKAVEILQEAAQHCRKEKGERSLVDGEDVAYIVSEKSRVPVTAVTDTEREKLLNLEERLHRRVIGQDEAVVAVAAALRRARAELRSKKRPISAFLFLGPTGVGKTELAKTVADVYFGDEKRMIRLDMSEYQEAASINRLIGVPGETGGGLLTEAIRKQPFALLLLDEFEKADPEILNVFLQVMEDGRLTDNEGRTVDFTNAIIVATSNAGSQFIQDKIRAAAPIAQIKKELLNNELKGVFRPELINRFDGVIVFRPLTSDEIEQVAWLMIGSITDELKSRGIEFRAVDEAVKELAAIGFDPVFGARPMRRVIQERVENALADALLKEEISRRDTVILEPGGVIRVEKGKKL
jgi:ATP-dependent Clp protease ATP-binding subunit ClpC